MQDMERKKFEDKWRDALRDAEVDPSDKVWSNIELDLERAEMGSYRHQILFYRMVAAASLIFALCAGAAGIYFFDQNKSNQQIVMDLLNEQKQMALNAQTNSTVNKTESNQAVSKVAPSQASLDQSGVTENTEIQSKRIAKSNRIYDAAKTSDKGESTSEGDGNPVSDNYVEVTEVEPSVVGENDAEQSSEFIRDASPQLTYTPTNAFQPEKQKSAEEAEVDPVVSMMAKLEKREEEIRKEELTKKKNSKSTEKTEGLWTSVGFAAGSFNSRGAGVTPTAQNAGLYSNLTTRNASEQEATAPGTTYSIGMNVGKRVSKKWILQSGLSYLNQSSNYTAQTAVSSKDYQTFTPESINAFDRLSSAQESPYPSDGQAESKATVINTAPYGVNNSVRYLTVPIQAGYLLIDSKVGLQLNAGISTDLFLQNMKKADGADIETIDEGIGEDTPYRAMNFSGLLGTELSYRVGSRYRISINPGVRYPFNSIYKSDLGVKSSPITMDLGLRFRYIFQ
jgi:hypothetical protein